MISFTRAKLVGRRSRRGREERSVRPAARHLYAVLSAQTPAARAAASGIRPLSTAATRRSRDQWASVGHYNLSDTTTIS
jgi:hypothetical protein